MNTSTLYQSRYQHPVHLSQKVIITRLKLLMFNLNP